MDSYILYKDLEGNIGKVRKHLSNFGVLVIRNVISDGYADELRNLFIKELCNMGSGLVRSDYETWKSKNMPTGPRYGMYQSGLVAFSNSMWISRYWSLKVFQALWDTDDVIFSLDGASVYPCSDRKVISGFNISKDWAHIDQTTPEFKCYQGQLVLSSNDSATFMCTPTSHLYNKQLVKESSKNWYKFNDNEKIRIKQYFGDLYQIPISAPKGSIILWDSRLIHSARGPTYSGGFRCVSYVCARPRSNYTSRNINTLARAYNEHRCTNHWGSKMFPNLSRWRNLNLDSMISNGYIGNIYGAPIELEKYIIK